ncbi:unnamed protein product [Rotaria socialis]
MLNSIDKLTLIHIIISQINAKLRSIDDYYSLLKTVHIHILKDNHICEATLAVSNKREYKKQSKNGFFILL